MNPNSTFTASSTRRRIFEELEKIAADPTYTTTITHHGRPLAVIISYDEFRRWQETARLAADPLLVRDLKDLEPDLQKGNIITYQELFGHPQPGLGEIQKGEIVYRVKHAAQEDSSKSTITGPKSETNDKP